MLRVVKWEQLSQASKFHLGLATAVILGSYIGFRNSQKRGRFKLRFLNLATLRFGLDQAMVFLYFWLALYISVDKDPKTGAILLPNGTDLLRFDARVLVAIFVLYFAWDLISHWMAGCGLYFTVKADPKLVPPTVDKLLQVPRYRTLITLGALAVAVVIMIVSESAKPAGSAASWWIAALIVLAIGYRMVKDMLEVTS